MAKTLVVLLAVLLAAPAARAATEEHATTIVPAAAQTRPLDPEKATDAYLALYSGEKRAQSNAYFEGGYWLILWNFLYGLGVAGLLLWSGFSARMRNWAERLIRVRALQPALYWIFFVVATTVLQLPFDLYQGYFREHQYGLSNLTFGGYLGEQGKGLLVALIMGAIGMVVLYAVFRRVRRNLWLWATAVVVAFALVGMMIAPVWIMPLFNKYEKLEDPAVRDPILGLARANGIGVDAVWKNDASKQSKRVSANVSGFLGTERITLNDNLLQRCTQVQVEQVMGHEMGHYVLHHVFKAVTEVTILFAVGFGLVLWAFERVRRRWGERWGIRGIEDPAGLPALWAAVAVFGLLSMPIFNGMVRQQEAEADLFGLNAVGKPDAEAQVDLMLGEYRKLDPSPLEEVLFFDHPGGRNRILMAMRWKAEHMPPPPPTE
jgi:STE24 endopeptidase